MSKEKSSWWQDEDTEFIQFGMANVATIENANLEKLNGMKLVEPPKRLMHCGRMYRFCNQTMSWRRQPDANDGEKIYLVQDLETEEVLWVSDSRPGKFIQPFIAYEDRENPIIKNCSLNHQ